MYHAGHPDGNYQMANRAQKFDPQCVISWEPGHHAEFDASSQLSRRRVR